MISKNMEKNKLEKDVWITIKTKIESEIEEVEFVTEGKLIKDDENYVITYNESEIMGEEGVMTSLTVIEDIITLDRSGKVNSRLVFTEGKTQASKYETEYGIMNIAIFTNNLSVDMTDNGGAIRIDYYIDFKSEIEDQNNMNIDKSKRKYIDLTIKEANN